MKSTLAKSIFLLTAFFFFHGCSTTIKEIKNPDDAKRPFMGVEFSPVFIALDKPIENFYTALNLDLVYPNTPAWKAGLRTGDALLAIEHKSFSDMGFKTPTEFRDYIALLSPGDTMNLTIFRKTVEGELIVSTETALREAAAHGWSPHDEVLLYVVHGVLHLCGYDDLTDEARPAMRVREREVLAGWQLVPTGLEA